MVLAIERKHCPPERINYEEKKFLNVEIPKHFEDNNYERNSSSNRWLSKSGKIQLKELWRNWSATKHKIVCTKDLLLNYYHEHHRMFFAFEFLSRVRNQNIVNAVLMTSKNLVFLLSTIKIEDWKNMWRTFPKHLLSLLTAFKENLILNFETRKFTQRRDREVKKGPDIEESFSFWASKRRQMIKYFWRLTWTSRFQWKTVE